MVNLNTILIVWWLKCAQRRCTKTVAEYTDTRRKNKPSGLIHIEVGIVVSSTVFRYVLSLSGYRCLHQKCMRYPSSWPNLCDMARINNIMVLTFPDWQNSLNFPWLENAFPFLQVFQSEWEHWTSQRIFSHCRHLVIFSSLSPFVSLMGLQQIFGTAFVSLQFLKLAFRLHCVKFHWRPTDSVCAEIYVVIERCFHCRVFRLVLPD